VSDPVAKRIAKRVAKRVANGSRIGSARAVYLSTVPMTSSRDGHCGVLEMVEEA
jgi:hypothetical protein